MKCPSFTVYCFLILYRCRVQEVKPLQAFWNFLDLFPHFFVSSFIFSLFLLLLYQGFKLYNCVSFLFSCYNTLNKPCPKQKTLLYRNMLVSMRTYIFTVSNSFSFTAQTMFPAKLLQLFWTCSIPLAVPFFLLHCLLSGERERELIFLQCHQLSAFIFHCETWAGQGKGWWCVQSLWLCLFYGYVSVAAAD